MDSVWVCAHAFLFCFTPHAQHVINDDSLFFDICFGTSLVKFVLRLARGRLPSHSLTYLIWFGIIGLGTWSIFYDNKDFLTYTHN